MAPPRLAAVALGAAVVLAACSGATDTAAPAVPIPTPERATPATDRGVETVRVPGDGLALAGDLRLPEGAGPHPGVVLVHGSGPNDRDGTTPGQLGMGFPRPVTVLADLADGLRDAGYAVLTYDKRSCGPFNRCADNGYPRPADDLRIEAFAADALAAVRYLRAHPAIAADAIAVAGHSQGATFVPALLLDAPDLAAGVMLAAPHDPVDALLAEQAATLAALAAAATPRPAGVEQQIAQVRQLARSVAGLRDGTGDDDVALGGATVGFWRSWVRVSDGVPALARQAPQPLLVLNGAADTNVGIAQTARWREALPGGDDRVVELDCVSHALNCLGTDDPLAVRAADIEAQVDSRVVAEVAGFLDGAVR